MFDGGMIRACSVESENIGLAVVHNTGSNSCSGMMECMFAVEIYGASEMCGGWIK